MQVRSLSAAAAIVVVALSSAACNPTTKSKAAPTTATVLPATATAADDATPTASPSASVTSQPAASSVPVVASASPVASSPAATTPAPAAGGATIDVCSLMTSAQASSINGVTYGAATPQHVENGLDTCDYKNNGSANPIDIQDLTTQVISLPGCYSELQDANGPGVKVAGVGDDAFGYSIGIAVKLGNRCIEISGLTEAELKDDYAPDAAMAKIMIAKLS
jgi:hypothetical protein